MKITKIERIELVRKYYIVDVFHETIHFKLIYYMGNNIKKEFNFKMDRTGKVVTCDNYSTNNLDFNLEINEIFSVVKKFEKEYGKDLVSKLIDIENKYNKLIKNEYDRYEIIDTRYLEDDISYLRREKARFNRARKKKELDRRIKDKEILLNNICVKNEYRMNMRNKVSLDYKYEMFEEANKILDDINKKLF